MTYKLSIKSVPIASFMVLAIVNYQLEMQT